MRRRTTNHHFCLSSAERQSARPFQINVQTTAATMSHGLIPERADNVFTDSVFINTLYYNSMMKLMAIDYGEKRVGIASTDEGGTFALPRAVWENDRELIGKVAEFKKEEGIELVIVGESKNYKGEPNRIMAEAEKFRAELESRGIKTVLHPEILTTMEARQLQGNTEMTDASAAALILKSYIDTLKNVV